MRRIFLFLLAAVLSVCTPATAADEPVAAPGAAEELPKLDGVLVDRVTGGIMQVKVEGVSLVLRFFDEKHRPVTPGVDGGLVRVVPIGRNPERRALVPTTDGLGLTHGQPLRKPHVFKLYISLTRAGSQEAVETYTVDFP